MLRYRYVPHIFLGSTKQDLEEMRQIVSNQTRPFATLEMMEDFPVGSNPPPETCKERLKVCDHYILLIYRRYGWIPEGSDKSITEMEYEWARELNLPIKVYIHELEDGVPHEIDHPEKLQAFIERVSLETTPRPVKSVAEFASLLLITLRDWLPLDSVGTQQVSGTVPTFAEPQNVLGDVLEDRLQELLRRRLGGDRMATWSTLQHHLTDHAGSLPRHVAAQYYLVAAQWALEDDREASEVERYFSRAIELDSQLDVRVFRANQLRKDKQYDEAMSVLSPLDQENVLQTALQILIEQGKGAEAEDLLAGAGWFEATPELSRQLAVCDLQARHFGKAQRSIERLLMQDNHSPAYSLTAGYIAYWQGMPEEFFNPKTLFPILMIPGLFTPTPEQAVYLEQALEHFNNAKQRSARNREGYVKSRMAWIVTASHLSSRWQEANREAIELLEEDPGNDSAWAYVVHYGVELDVERHVEPVQRLIQEGKASLNQIVTMAHYQIQQEDFTAARNLLDDQRIQFRRHDELGRWEALMVFVLIQSGDEAEALRVMQESENLEDPVKQRMQLNLYERQGNQEAALELAERFARASGDRIDLRNWSYIAYDTGDWNRVAPAAEAWLAQHAERQAAELYALACMHLTRYNEALETVTTHESIFPDGGNNRFVLEIKFDAYWHLGRIFDTLQTVEQLWKHAPSEVLAVRWANLFTNQGEIMQAVHVLEKSIAEGVNTPAVYATLIDLLTTRDPYQAFAYAKRALEENRDNPHLYLRAMNCAFQTGHDQEGAEIMNEYHARFPDQSDLRLMSLEDVLQRLEQNREKHTKLQKEYLSGAIPVQVFADATSQSTGAIFYHWWHSDVGEWQLPIGYGGRQAVHPMIFQNRKVVMEYSAWLSAHAMGLIPALEQGFTSFVVSPHLMDCIQADIQQLTPGQPSRVQLSQELQEILPRVKKREVQMPEMDNTVGSELPVYDMQRLLAARENEAFLVTDGFVVEVSLEGEMPAELEEQRVYVREVLAALIQMGELPETVLESAPYAGLDIRPDKVNLLHEGSRLLVDRVFLEELLETDRLQVAAEVFELLVPSDIQKSLDREIQNISQIERNVDWLHELMNQLRRLNDAGKLEYVPRVEPRENVKILSHQMVEAVGYQTESLVPYWCEDRYLNRAPLAVNLFDVLLYLLASGVILEPDYRNYMTQLYRKNTHFRVPPAFLLFGLLKQARLVNGQLVENRHLSAIRSHISSATAEKSIIGREVLNEGGATEGLLYLNHLQDVVTDTLVGLWGDREIEQVTCQAASAWLLSHAYLSLADVPHLAPHVPPDLQESGGQFRLLIKGLQLENKESYFNWLATYLEARWKHAVDSQLYLRLFLRKTGILENFRFIQDQLPESLHALLEDPAEE
ncbi:DUF4062 domain-containing protein [Tumebacillus sp. ITR2]|uniref:DUF4062 domain-containing protein n=1 Tax=Tumebacillus amylolyticus TaxID=2801339 RepID=A0ABS1JGK5_9BACL|nr:DUF4062 domain-containing protein [Tumebacillus amylolyticus]MBL0388708.1 DUF4062 domain-containing protein [Tumebacillus amylolyticus]